MSLEKLKGSSWPFRWERGIVTCTGLRVGAVEGWGRCHCGGRTQVVLMGGCPGRAFGRMGTLVVRITGSSVLVEDVVDGGAGRCAEGWHHAVLVLAWGWSVVCCV